MPVGYLEGNAYFSPIAYMHFNPRTLAGGCDRVSVPRVLLSFP